MFFGSILGGILSDRFGRLLIYRCGAILSLVSGVAIGFAPNIYVFAFLRCMVAISSCAAAKVAVVYVVEICNERWRSFAGLSYTIGFGLGCMLLSVFAYFIRDWRTLEIAISSTFAVCVVVSFCVDKSPRWVYVQGDSREAETICRHIARRNGIVVSDEVWDQFEGVKEDESKEKKVESKNTLKEMLIRPFTRLMLLNNMFVWMTTSLVYYGLTLNSGALAGNIFINNAAGGLMELMAALVSGPAIAKFGCRNSVIFYEFLASFSCLVSTIAIQFANSNKAVETLGVVLAMIGRFGISAAWAVMYLHTPALFATPGRSSALGASSMASRVGSIITPFTLQLQYNIPWLTQTVFGIGAFIVACLCTLYPETHGRPMMSSYDEAEMRFKRHVTQTRLYRIVCCFRSRPIEEDYNAREFETMEKVA
uniref:Solute carrier family 22 member 4-like n=1 Tax=Phallusia mammillata TaxID=59560 RepID=A0A6F9DRT2_9ASCI|nr:solute carrier family 22 member 4-like [Phallusia mammillata]